MNISGLLRAKHVGIRDLKNRLSEYLDKGAPLVATDRGIPKYFLVPYEEMAELAEMMEELSDRELVAQVQEGRREYREGGWIPADSMWKRLDKRAKANTRKR